MTTPTLDCLLLKCDEVREKLRETRQYNRGTTMLTLVSLNLWLFAILAAFVYVARYS